MKAFKTLFGKAGNPDGEPENHGDLWAAIHHCDNRLATVDERLRVALMFIVPILSFLAAIQLALLGLLVG